MPRNFNSSEIMKRTKLKRAAALMRVEMLQQTTPRTSAAGVTSMAMKVDPYRAMIDAEIERRKQQ